MSAIIFFDNQLAQLIVSWRSPFLDSFFFIVTQLGNWLVITGLFILIASLFYFYKKQNLIFPLFVVLSGSGLMTVIIKFMVNRARPGGDIPLYTETLSSFPSAHAALAAALFGFLIYSLWRFSKSKNFRKIFYSVLLFLIIILVGFSRLYLGVHFLSDILAGYLTGLMWVLIGMYLSRKRSA